MVVDNYKLPVAWKLWPEVEDIYVEELAHLNFDPADIFYSENEPVDGRSMTSLYRYYTPRENRMHT